MSVEEVLKEVHGKLSSGNTELIFGEAKVFKDKAIIPVGSVMIGLGGGLGKGQSEGAMGQEKAKKGMEGSGEGGGYGGMMKICPWGYIVVTPEDVKFEPVYNKMMIAGICACVMIACIKTIRRSRWGHHCCSREKGKES